MADNREFIIRNTEGGSVSISEDVIAIIAWEAMREVEGYGGTPASLTGELQELLGRKNATRGIRVVGGESGVTVDAFVSVRAGYSVTKTARAIQETVGKAVQDMTGIHVDAVNVNVSGITFEKEKQTN